MDNDARGLLFFILGFACFWLVFDEFFGKKYISQLTGLMTPNLSVGLIDITPSPTNPNWSNQQQAQSNAQKAKDQVNKNSSLSKENKNWLNSLIDKFWSNPIQQKEA